METKTCYRCGQFGHFSKDCVGKGTAQEPLVPAGHTKFRYSQLHEPLVRIAFAQVSRSNHKEPCIV
jgi:hypothetical protein